MALGTPHSVAQLLGSAVQELSGVGGCHAPHCCLSFLGTQVLELMFHGLKEPPGTCCWYLKKFIKFKLYGQLVGNRTQT